MNNYQFKTTAESYHIGGGRHVCTGCGKLFKRGETFEIAWVYDSKHDVRCPVNIHQNHQCRESATNKVLGESPVSQAVSESH